jgi:hypothetical protein
MGLARSDGTLIVAVSIAMPNSFAAKLQVDDLFAAVIRLSADGRRIACDISLSLNLGKGLNHFDSLRVTMGLNSIAGRIVGEQTDGFHVLSIGVADSSF